MPSPTEKLCLACTLCCNGGLFADLKLSAADRSRLKRDSIALRLTRTGKLSQPCQALCGPKCAIYASRPDYCRWFECHLLQRVKAGEVSAGSALKAIRTARRRLARVERLLAALGNRDASIAVSVRFRRLACSLTTSAPDPVQAALYADLTLAMHDLNHFLAEHFYPGSRPSSGPPGRTE
jgi:uncharacterized protein